MSQQARIEKLLENPALNPSSRSFAESLLGNCKKWGSLTAKQWSAFERMEARFDPEVIAARKDWYDSWDENMAQKLQIAAKYYLKNPPYFGEVAAKIVEDKTYIPSEKLYRKMVETSMSKRCLQPTIPSQHTPMARLFRFAIARTRHFAVCEGRLLWSYLTRATCHQPQREVDPTLSCRSAPRKPSALKNAGLNAIKDKLCLNLNMAKSVPIPRNSSPLLYRAGVRF